MARVLAIWCMDWPAVAAAVAAGLPPDCSGGGHAGQPGHRLFGVGPLGRVRPGLRRQESQARCPQLHVVTADPARDARHFENVTAAVDDLVPRAEVLRPGLLVLPVRGAARYFEVGQAAAERLVDAVAAAGAECQVGIADQLPRSLRRTGSRIGGFQIRRCSCPHCRSGSLPSSRAAAVVTIWRICCGAWGFRTSVSSQRCPYRCGLPVRGRRGRRAPFARGEPTRGPSGREPARARRRHGLRSADRPGGYRGVRRPIAGLHPAPRAGDGRCQVHQLAIHAVTANGEELQRVWRCAKP